MRQLVLLLSLSILTLCPAAPAHSDDVPKHDVAGSHDNPIVSRFSGSVIVGYQATDFGQATLPLGKYENGGLVRTEALEGKVTRIAYIAPAGKSALEIFRNFQTAMESSGFQIRFQCEQSQRCGDASGFVSAVAGTGTIGSLSNGNSYHNLMVDTLWPIGDNIHAATMHLARPQGDVDAFVLVVGNANQPAGVLLQIVEAKAMATGQVTVDAKAMSQGLAQNGHIALYGIHFASDSAVLGKDSAATLAEMAKLLKAQPALKVYIVGHTDDSGSLAHNLALSQQRAEAVVKALETQYGIAPARLAAKGLASYAPVASNRDDAGKARNRRVELVEQ